MKKIISACLIFLGAASAQAQEIEMADGLRSEGKIYVVVAILLIILLGLIGYLVMIDRKTARLERKLDEQNRSSHPARK